MSAPSTDRRAEVQVTADCPQFPLPGSSHRGPGELRRLRSPARVAIDGAEAWIAISHDHVDHILASSQMSRELTYGEAAPRFPSMFAPPPEMIVSLDGEAHGALRRMAEQAMSEADVTNRAAAADATAACVEAVRERIRTTGQADLVADYAEPLAGRAVCGLLGIPASDVTLFTSWVKAVADLSTPPEEMAAAWGDLGGYVAGLVTRRLDHPGDDLISALTRVAPTQGVPAEHVVGLVLALVGGGYDSTQSILGVTLHECLQTYRDLWDEVARDRLIAPAALDELLRLVNLNPGDVTGLHRIAREDVALGGCTIRAGEAVFVSVTSANRDPAYFDAPDTADFSRSPNPHRAFGYGPHRCLGEAFARSVLAVSLAGLAVSLPELRVGADAPRWREHTVNHSLASLPVTYGANSSEGGSAPQRP